jgi:hypothetical protein
MWELNDSVNNFLPKRPNESWVKIYIDGIVMDPITCICTQATILDEGHKGISPNLTHHILNTLQEDVQSHLFDTFIINHQNHFFIISNNLCYKTLTGSMTVLLKCITQI